MSKKEKEDERIERIIRGLLKLPENRRCINCNSLGPQYVCTTFLTFICTNCSGIHREFTHRVKSVSMAKFKAEEVSALQAGGNESDKEESRESRKLGLNCGHYKSPNYESRYDQKGRSHPGGISDDKSIKYYYDERRSPRYAQENSRYGGFKKSPVRFAVVDDRFRDDGAQSRRESANHRFSNKDGRFGSLSPDRKKSMDQSSSPVAQPVKDIPGQNARLCNVSEDSNKDNPPSTTSGGNMPMSGDISAAVPSGLMLTLLDNMGASTNATGGNVPIDVSPAVTPGQMLALSSSAGTSTIASGENMPNGNVSAAVPLGQISTSPNSAGLSISASGKSTPAGGISPAATVDQTLSLHDTFDSTTPSTTSLPVQPSDGAPSQAAPAIHGDSTFKAPNGKQVPSMQQHQLSEFPSADSKPSGQPTCTTTVGLQITSASAEFTHDVTKVAQESSSGVKSQQLPVETKSIGRKELPADLFTASYSPATGSIPGWQSALPYGMGFGMQYYPNAAAALTNVSVPRNLLPSTSIDKNSLGLMATQAPSYASAMPLQSSSFASPTSGAYMGQQLHMNTQPSRPQGAAGAYDTDAHFGSQNITSNLPAAIHYLLLQIHFLLWEGTHLDKPRIIFGLQSLKFVEQKSGVPSVEDQMKQAA
ncbi:hypothetical protein GH714_032873 [Hevea brasiliensis]|uniref:Arf-GAP domain-containing protein n=1 Tax=Hevea brasiliensis TaxID=3981 RepID=A0A6A6LWW4_HEVBR|nr:hypothetical protein GH714_032873 [Hevea brasiliensis]